jgi:isocitrate lyase
MIAYLKGVQRQEIRKGVASVKHQIMAGSDLGDDHKSFFAGDKALKAGGENNTSNQFEVTATKNKGRAKIAKVA